MEIGRSGSVRRCSRLDSRGSLAFHFILGRLGSVLLVNSLNLSSI
jgi:hypothetical protein